MTDYGYGWRFPNPIPGVPQTDPKNWSDGLGKGAYLPDVPQFNPYADSGYILGAAGVNQQNTNAQGDHDYGVLRGGQTFGYDAAGHGISGGAAYNPYSQAAVLQRSYDNTKRGTTNSYAAQGQLYSGALKNAQATNAYNFNVSSDALQRGASDYYHGLDSSLQGTKTAGQTSIAQLVIDALNRFTYGQQG